MLNPTQFQAKEDKVKAVDDFSFVREAQLGG